MYTEETAKTKWCPFARVLTTIKDPRGEPITVTSINRSSDDAGRDLFYGFCIGSQCMAWQSKRQLSAHGAARLAEGKYPDEFSGIEVGYCGLAGNPSCK